MMKQLANGKRLLILCQLLSAEKSVGELAESVGLSQSALSQHLAKMREAGLWIVKSAGRWSIIASPACRQMRSCPRST